jgi:hypothetical protein
MTITLTPQTEAMLIEKPHRDGIDANRVADALLSAVLQWEIQEETETTEGIRRGLDASDAGRVREFTDFASHMRLKYALPVHLSDSEIGNTP